MDITARIEQWEKMTREAPDDMSWFSLGNAYRDAGRLGEAEAALAQAITLNPGMSRAYQLRGQVLVELQRTDEAAAVLTTGYTTAMTRGDTMPARAMAALLQKLGKPLPEVAAPAEPATLVPGDQVIDRKTGQPGRRLDEQPTRGPIGKFIRDHYSHETWQLWIRQGTKVINELRLDFSNAAHMKMYDQHMFEWLGFTEDEAREYAKTHPPER